MTQKLNMIGKFVKRKCQRNGNKIKKILRVFYGTEKVFLILTVYGKLKKISAKSACHHKIEREEEEQV